MNKDEARRILIGELARYCSYSYSDLRYLLRSPDCFKVTGPSGTEYQIEAVILGEDRRTGALAIMASIDDGGWSALWGAPGSGFTMSREGKVAAGGELGELLSLREGTAQAFHTSGATVNIKGGQFLTVTLLHPPAWELSDSEQRDFARQVAQYVRDTYTGYERLESVSIRFAKVVGEGPMDFTISTRPYSFTRHELGAPTNALRGPTH